MYLPPNELERTFAKVAAVRQQLRARALEGLQPQLDWRTLADVIADMYGIDILMFEVTASGRTVAGNVERYRDNRAVIMVRSQQTEDMLRFVSVKELCHIMLDEQDDWSSDAIATIREMKVEFDLAKTNGDGVLNPSRTQMSEYLALVAAVALMYPCEYHAADKAKVESGEKSIAKIALEHGMPGWAIELAFNHEHIFNRYKGI